MDCEETPDKGEALLSEGIQSTANQCEFKVWKCTVNSNSNSTFIALNLCQKTDSKAHHTKTLFNIQKPETLQGSAPRKCNTNKVRTTKKLQTAASLFSMVTTWTNKTNMTWL